MDALQPLADAIAERVWAKTCQGKFPHTEVPGGTRWTNLGGLQNGVARSGKWGKCPMLCMGMNTHDPRCEELIYTVRVGCSRAGNFWGWALRKHGIAVAPAADIAILAGSLQRLPIGMSRGPKVYFFRAGSMVKIGMSDIPKKRLGQIRGGCPFPVSYELSVYGSIREERALHKLFKEYRACGEWFHQNPTLDELIRLLRFIGVGGSALA